MSSQIPQEVLSFFPYNSFRPGQEEVIRLVYNGVRNRNIMIIEAMSGFGKTIAVLSAVLPIAVKKGLKVLYMARTHKEHERVIEEALAISNKGKIIKAIALRGRSEMCLLDEVKRKRSYKVILELCEELRRRGLCPYYMRFLERMHEILHDVYRCKKPYLASEIIIKCKDMGVCPYEVAKALLKDSLLIACSYAYLLNPEIMKRFIRYLGTSLEGLIIIIDEAHNILDITTEYLSEELSERILYNAIQEAKEELNFPAIIKFLKSLLEVLKQYREAIREEGILPNELPERIAKNVTGISLDDLIILLEEAGEIVKERRILEGKSPNSNLSNVARFLRAWYEATVRDDRVCIISSNKREFKVMILAFDPSPILRPLLENSYSSILISATLQPLDAYVDIIGLNKERVITKSIQPPLPRNKVLILGAKGVTTDFEKRSLNMYQKIVERILEAVENSPGNVGIFVASYEVLRGLLKAGLEDEIKSCGKSLFIEKPDATSAENDILVRKFKECANKGGGVLLGVQGGRNAEGEDFPGREMSTVVIVGIPYARPTPSINARLKYLEKKFPEKGRLYGYILPAIRKAVQAAGRPLRDLKHKTAIIFLDYRFLQKPCKELLPRWMRELLKMLPDEEGALAKELALFFGLELVKSI